jgi:hypothetical protein
MKIRSILGWALGALVVLMSSAVPGLAFRNTASITLSAPEDPTAVLIALGGAGLVWQYFRSRARK